MAELRTRETSLAPHDWFSRWFEDWPFPPRWPELWRTRLLEEVEPMRVEEFREDKTLVVRAEMPGIDPDQDVEIDVSDQTLRIRAERRQETKVDEKGRYRSEFRYGSFTRTVPLPAGATEQDVKATYKDGILEVRIPVDDGKAATRKIPIERS
ncbi:MAG: Hsp20/alpha crystallin family protein [Acidimicrobiia bacterium]|jgi:HSP20 family protein